VIERRVFQSLSRAIGSKPSIISPQRMQIPVGARSFGLIADASREYA
jgi:hypothetical protein